MKTRVINILSHEPDYRFIADEDRPEVSWDTPDGKWVGIYRNEIPDKLGGEVLKYTDEFEYEAWQPDFRADKVYSHRFEDGLVHRLFPAETVKEFYGIKLRNKTQSKAMVDFLLEYSQQYPVVINLNGDLSRINAQIIAAASHLPIFQTYRGTLHLPSTMMLKPRLNVLASLTYYFKHRQAKKLLPSCDYVSHMNDLYLDELAKLYKGPKTKLTSGCDFDFWKKTDKPASRKAMDIPENVPVFFTSSLLIPIKQVDKVIDIFLELDEQYEFMLVISGHGTEKYEQYLKNLAAPLLKKNKARFTGYVTGEALRNYYNAADLFINSSISEGGPVSAMKAIACETPVMSTNIGNVAERMQQNQTGILVGEQDYPRWKSAIQEVLQGKAIKLFDRNEAREQYDWQEVAASFSKVYRLLSEKYYGKVKHQAETPSVTARQKAG